MIGYIIRRLLALLPILFGVAIFVFIATRMMPGNIAQIMCGNNCTDEQIAELEADYGLDKPIPEQFVEWIGGMARGDLGDSFLRNRPVADEIVDRLPITLELLILTMIISTVVGVGMGAISAMNHRRWPDAGIRVFNIMGMALPAFWVATLVILLPSIWFSYAPPFQHISIFEDPWGNMREYVPPALVMGLASSCGLARIVRGSILGVVGQDFIRTARAKGLSESLVIRRHALGNAMLPVVTILGMQVAGLMGGAVIIEQVFALNGLGRLVFESATMRDYPVLQVMALYTVVVVVMMFLFIDLAYAWLDPRVRLTGGQHA